MVISVNWLCTAPKTNKQKNPIHLKSIAFQFWGILPLSRSKNSFLRSNTGCQGISFLPRQTDLGLKQSGNYCKCILWVDCIALFVTDSFLRLSKTNELLITAEFVCNLTSAPLDPLLHEMLSSQDGILVFPGYWDIQTTTIFFFFQGTLMTMPCISHYSVPSPLLLFMWIQ